MRTTALISTALLLAFSQGLVKADPAEPGYQFGVLLHTYPDRWELQRRHEDPLVTLPTSRMTLNAHLDNFFRTDEGFLLGVDGRVHWQDRAAMLDNRVQSGSDFDYLGMDVQALSGWRFGAPGDTVRYDMRMGVGYRDLSRSRWSGSSLDDDSGWLYTQLSGGPRFSAGNWRGFLELGVRMPVDPDDRAFLSTAEGAGNGRRSAGFVSFQNYFQLSEQAGLRLDLYYDSQRYGPTEGARWHSTARDELSTGRDRDVFGFEMGLQF